MFEDFLHIHPEVAETLDAGRPIVALESTVISHGLPYPHNLTSARALEAAVRVHGATPATIAILAGKIHVGLTDDQLTHFATLPGSEVRKTSRRDLPIVLSQQRYGGTTVAGTMILAQQVGIEMFATGGIGGVHRGHPFDVSADLIELGRTPITVVSSGAKSILDLPATREVLETHGVTVAGYGTDELPAFFTRANGLAVDVRVDTPQEAAALIAARRALGLQSATLITVPVPAEAAPDPTIIEAAIVQAQTEADTQGISGPAATPFLLERVAVLTDGVSRRANQALLANNAALAAQIAVALHLIFA